jgi:tetratricopeptide (TPR) repeat protein
MTAFFRRLWLVHSKNILLGSLVFLTAFGFALSGVNPSFYTDDCAEFITVAATLGVAHPPGYPLLVLAQHLMTMLGFPLFFSVNLLSALLAALICLLIFHLLNRGFQVPTLMSLAFSFLWLAGASCYPSALSAKRGVYVLAGLFVVAILVCILAGRLKLAAFLYGLSLGGHWMSMAAFGPGLFFLAYESFRQKPRGKHDLLQAFLFLIMGLSLYLYLPLRAAMDPVINWGYPARWDLFLEHVMRTSESGKDFTSDISQWIQSAVFYLRTAILEFSGVGLLALAGIYFEWRKNRRRTFGLLLTWVGVMAAVSLFSKFSSRRVVIIEYYSISSWVLLVLFSGLGAWGLFRLFSKWQSRASAVGAALLAFSLVGTGLRAAGNGQTYYTCFYDYTLNAWKPLPANSFFICKGDELQFTSWYFQWVEGRRSDLAVLGSSLNLDFNRIHQARSHPDLKIPFPSRTRDKIYLSGPIIPWMVEGNPQRRLFFTFPPKEENLENLKLVPLGLTQEGTPSPREPRFDEVSNESFWANARLRHLNEPQSRVELFTWNSVLQDYGSKRLLLALYEMNRADALKAAKPDQAREWYLKSLADLMAVKDWNPAVSRFALEEGADFVHLGDIFPAIAFNRGVLLNIGVAYLYLGDMEQAKAWIAKATRSLPKDADVYFFAGLVALQASNLPEAKRLLQKTIRLDPSHAKAGQLLKNLGP